jgi:hypothetical protein
LCQSCTSGAKHHKPSKLYKLLNILLLHVIQQFFLVFHGAGYLCDINIEQTGIVQSVKNQNQLIIGNWSAVDYTINFNYPSDRHDITGILLKVPLNIINQQTNQWVRG